MRSGTITASFITAQAVAASTSAAEAGTSLLEKRQATGEDSCQDVHVFLSRGNNEPYPGRQGVLAEAICSGLDSCDYEDIAFDNALETNYCKAVEDGARAGLVQIRAYNKRCPDAHLVLSGYSQGGHVIGDVLGGGGGTFFQDCVQKSNEGLDPESAPGNKIVAALIFGDVRHTAGQSYNVLSGADDDGLFPRPGGQLSKMNEYADVLQNFCPETDPICAQGDEGETHLNYFDVYTDRAAAWVQDKIQEAGGPSSSSATSASSASSTSQASSTDSASSTSAESSASASASASSSSTSASADDTATPTDGTQTSPTTDAESDGGEANSASENDDDDDDDSSATRAAKSPLALGFALLVAHIFMA